MGLLNLASAMSAWRGYEYYKSRKVKRCQQTDDAVYTGEVSGSGANTYQVTIDLEHPRSSHCDCPHANGRRIVCKHMVALYFAAFPDEAEDYYDRMMKAEAEAEEYQDRLANAVMAHVAKMKKEDLRQWLLQLLFEGPEWQYERFVRENIDEYWNI